MKEILSAVVFCLMVTIASCQSPGANAQSAANVKQAIKRTISVDEFDKKLASLPNAQLIDVRTPEEYAGGHLKNAVNLNIRSDDFVDQLNKLDKTRPVMVYCMSGGRSGQAANKMEELGFSEVYNMDGGIMKWGNAGKPEEKGTATAKPDAITLDAFNKMIAVNKYVLVDYNAKWCEPCKKMLPVLESLANRKKDKLSLVKIDADENKELMKQKGIAGIPYLELYHDGKLVWKHDGFIEEKDLLKETKL